MTTNETAPGALPRAEGQHTSHGLNETQPPVPPESQGLDLCSEALRLASLGWPVFPLEPSAKRPLGSLVPHGFKEATTDPKTIREWCDSEPNANLGTAPSAETLVVAIDGGGTAIARFEEIAPTWGGLPKTVTCQTANGVHYYFAVPPGHGLRSAAKQYPFGPEVEVDLRGLGTAYCVAPPSIHPSGVRYEWRKGCAPWETIIAPIPAGLLLALRAHLGVDATKLKLTATNGDAGAVSLDKLKEALSHLKAPRYERESWLRVLMALHAATDGSDEGFALALEWSNADPEPERIANERGLRKQWDGLRRDDTENAVTVGTLYQWAKDDSGGRFRPPLPDRSEGFGSIGGAVSGAAGVSWPAPTIPEDDLPPAPPFDLSMIPGPVGTWLVDTSKRMPCPPDFLLVGALTALASVLGRHLCIRPETFTTWTPTATCWGLIVGRPGWLKTPALSSVMSPLVALEREADEQREGAERERDAARTIHKAKRAALEESLKKAVKGNDDAAVAEIQRALAGLDVPKELHARRYRTSDSTAEALQEILKVQPDDGILLFRDEIPGWLDMLGREGREGERAFFLEGWDSSSGYRSDRISRGPVSIPPFSLSVLGGIQPGPLLSRFGSAIAGGAGADGLLERFQLIAYPDAVPDWTTPNTLPDMEIVRAAESIFASLAHIQPHEIGAARDHDSPPFLRFDPRAQEAWDAWRRDHHRRGATGASTSMDGWLSKNPKTLAGLAILMHLLAERSGPVKADSLDLALSILRWSEAHAARIYGVATRRGEAGARVIVERLRAGKIRPSFTPREIQRRGWMHLAGKDDVSDALEVLQDWGAVRIHHRQAKSVGGRSTVDVEAHPSLALGTTPPTPPAPESGMTKPTEPSHGSGFVGSVSEVSSAVSPCEHHPAPSRERRDFLDRACQRWTIPECLRPKLIRLAAPLILQGHRLEPDRSPAPATLARLRQDARAAGISASLWDADLLAALAAAEMGGEANCSAPP